MELSSTIPFEERSRPFLTRMGQTIGLAFSDPLRLFSHVPADDLWLPLVYGVIVGTVTMLFGLLWNLLFGGLSMIARDVDAAEFAISTGAYILFMVFSPLLIAVGLFISAGIYHLGLLLLGDGKRGFAVTFRALAYGNTPGLLSVIPICGGIVGGIWAIVLVVIAGKLGHGTDWWRAILAYFLPTILCCCLLVWLATALGLIGTFANL